MAAAERARLHERADPRPVSDPPRRPRRCRATAARIDAFVARASAAARSSIARTGAARSSAAAAQRAHYLVAERGGAIARLLPLSEIRSPLFGKALVSAGFAVGGGILADDAATAQALGRAAWALADELGCPSLELRGGALPRAGLAGRRRHAMPASPAALPPTTRRDLLAIPRKQRAEVRQALGIRPAGSRSARPQAERDAHYRGLCRERAQSRHAGLPARAVRRGARRIRRRCRHPDRLHRRQAARERAQLLPQRRGRCPIGAAARATRGHWRANDTMYFELMRHARARGAARASISAARRPARALRVQEELGLRAGAARLCVSAPATARARADQPAEPQIPAQDRAVEAVAAAGSPTCSAR